MINRDIRSAENKSVWKFGNENANISKINLEKVTNKRNRSNEKWIPGLEDMIDELEYSENNQGEIVREYKQNIQDLWNTIRWIHLGIMDREEGVDGVQNKERLLKTVGVKHHSLYT